VGQNLGTESTRERRNIFISIDKQFSKTGKIGVFLENREFHVYANLRAAEGCRSSLGKI
jgi:hypothetical protein